MKPQGLHVLLGEIWQCIYVLCVLVNNLMVLSFSIKYLTGYIFIASPNLRVSDRQRKNAFVPEGFYLLGILRFLKKGTHLF